MKSYLAALMVCLASGCQTDPNLTAEQRRAAGHARQAENEQRHQAEELRNRFKRYTTGDLQVMRARYRELTIKTTSSDIAAAPLAAKIWGNADRDNTEKLIMVERELLRRYKLGDKDAFLPDFKPPA